MNFDSYIIPSDAMEGAFISTQNSRQRVNDRYGALTEMLQFNLTFNETCINALEGTLSQLGPMIKADSDNPSAKEIVDKLATKVRTAEKHRTEIDKNSGNWDSIGRKAKRDIIWSAKDLKHPDVRPNVTALQNLTKDDDPWSQRMLSASERLVAVGNKLDSYKAWMDKPEWQKTHPTVLKAANLYRAIMNAIVNDLWSTANDARWLSASVSKA